MMKLYAFLIPSVLGLVLFCLGESTKDITLIYLSFFLFAVAYALMLYTVTKIMQDITGIK